MRPFVMHLKSFVSVLLSALCSAVALRAAPARPASTPATPAAPEDAAHAVLAWDAAGLKRYHDANAQLPPPAPGENRIVFMGDSITDAWAPSFPKLFPGKPYLGRGISGQTTQQMLVRFRPDVIALQPTVVVILAGTNDIAGNTGLSTQQMIVDNFASMLDLAAFHHIKVVLLSVLPAADYSWRSGMEPAEKIVALNRALEDLAARRGATYVDLHTPMADERHGLKEEYGDDGVHPNAAGYAVMAPLVEAGIQRALAGK